MKRRYANRPNWGRIIEKEYKHYLHEDELFKGIISFLTLKKVKEPLIVKYGSEEVCIVDDGYVWMMHFPSGENYSVTTSLDHNGKIVQWYFDIIDFQGFTSDGVPFNDDLYLDLVLLPNGQYFILDVEELEEALTGGIITKNQYDKAKSTLSELMESIIQKSNVIVMQTEEHFALLNSLGREN